MNHVKPAAAALPAAFAETPALYRALGAAQMAINSEGIEPRLRHLITLRASQINGCGFCVGMHLAEARRDSETQERLDKIVVWDQVDDFTEREKAALEWTEALTALDRKTGYRGLRTKLRTHFSDKEIGVLTAIVGMINLWNRVQVSHH
ncbi:MAG: carboxymuconolactone decarboxylase family protein [Rhodospirillaceae bacterium]|nr:carboxymuconolactone decarboxylase family protein [Rhodospirillaceae bacterium]